MVHALPARLLDLEGRERAVGDEQIGFRLLEVAQERPRHLARVVVELALESPGPVHARAALDQLDRRSRHEPQEVARLEADLLHAEMARHLVGDLAERAPELARELPLAVERGHAAADLRRADDLDAAPPEDADGRRARLGRVELDRRGVEERDLAALAEAGGRRLTAEPAAEAPSVARQPPAAVDAEHLLHAPAEPPVAVRPVGEPREGGAEPPEQLGVAEEAVAEPDALARRARDARVLHQAREVDRPAVRRRVGAVRVAEVAAEAQVDDAPILGRRERRAVPVVLLVRRVEQVGERGAEVVAAPAAGADVVDPFRLGGQGRRSGSLRRPYTRRHAHGLTVPESGDPW